MEQNEKEKFEIEAVERVTSVDYFAWIRWPWKKKLIDQNNAGEEEKWFFFFCIIILCVRQRTTTR